MKRDEVRKVSREAFEQLVRDVEAGKSDKLRAYLKAMGRFHRYSVGNAILIQLLSGVAALGSAREERGARHRNHGTGRVS